MINEKQLITELELEIGETYNDDIIKGLKRAIEIVKNELLVGEWIPVSERLPKSEDKYAWFKCNVTIMRSHWPTSSYDVCDSPYDEYFVTEAMYDTCQKIWHIGNMQCLNALIDIEDLPLNSDYVIAWQDLPEPYKGE